MIKKTRVNRIDGVIRFTYVSITAFYPLVFFINYYLVDIPEVSILNGGLIVNQNVIAQVIAIYVFALCGFFCASRYSIARIKSGGGGFSASRIPMNRIVLPKIYVDLFSACLILFFSINIYINRSSVVDEYIHSGLSSDSSGFVNIRNIIDLLIHELLIVRIVYCAPRERVFGKVDGLIFVAYIALKVITGGRFGIVIFICTWLLGYFFVWGRNTNKRQIFLFVFSIFGILFLTLIFRLKTFDLVKGISYFGLEYYLSGLSLINSIKFVNLDRAPDFLLFFIDPFVYSFRSFFPFDMSLEMGRWVASVGTENFYPKGGALLAGQIFLGSKSYLFIFLYFYFIGCLFGFFSKSLMSRSQLRQAISLAGLSVFFFSSFRTEYYLQMTILIKSVFLYNLIAYFVLMVLANRKNINGRINHEYT